MLHIAPRDLQVNSNNNYNYTHHQEFVLLSENFGAKVR